jgi:large subunit ribosomal protein L4
MKFDVVDTKNAKVGQIELDDSVFGAVVREHLFWEVVKMERANARRGTHSTKTVSEVKGSTKKPYKQKGTGRARHGTNYAMNMRGGGVVFGPKPRDYSYQVPKKAVAQAIRCALSKRREENRLHVVQGWEPSTPKTKDAAAVLQGFGVRRALIIDFPQNENLARSVSNLPEAKFLSVEDLNLVDLLHFDDLFVSEQAAERLNEKYHTELSRKEKELREASNA